MLHWVFRRQNQRRGFGYRHSFARGSQEAVTKAWGKGNRDGKEANTHTMCNEQRLYGHLGLCSSGGL